MATMNSKVNKARIFFTKIKENAFVKWYSELLVKNPYITKGLTAGAIMSSADMVS